MMLKSLTVALLTLSAASAATTALARDRDDGNKSFDRWCATHQQCDQWQDRHEDIKGGDPRPAAAPEIDPAGAMGALTLLAGGLAVMRGRRPGKTRT